MVKRLKLNEKDLRDAEPKPGVSYQDFDTDVIGFAMRIQSLGARTFTIDYRHAGRQRRMNIGRWPNWSVTADNPDPLVTPMSVAGDLWQLGAQRLICDNSTSANVVGRLLRDVRPLLMVTDLSYEVEYDPSWRNQAVAAKPGALCPPVP